MLVPLSWLKDYVDITISAEELQEKLFSCGFEVEELTKLGKDVTGVVVGKVLETAKHPDADRLTVCKVDCGEYGVKQICTAATNVFAGALVPCALDGATVLHEGGVQKIKNGKLRGVASEGMFCSGEELGINDDYYEGAEFNGILILKEEDAKIGQDIREVVGLDDWLFDISITANRPDCQSILGIAREVAAILKQPLKFPALDYKAVPTSVKIPVTVEEPALCPRYMGQYVANVKIGTAPQWMRRRLALCGLRSVSDIVDITNFVLLEMGQPMHAFDRSFLRGGKIIVRRAKKGEKIVTLDEKEFKLDTSNLLICDGEGGVALAGIMGGLNSEIKPDTKDVFFEAAKFARDSVRKTSRALGQRSDSSARFEKGVDAYTPEVAMKRAMHLVEELGCGQPTAYLTDVNNADMAQKTIDTTYEKINALLGIEVPQKEVDAILTRLGFGVKSKGDALSATVPLWREDVDGYPDLAEEVIRSYGYEHIVPTFLENATVTHGGLDLAQKQEQKFKNTLKAEGYYEACNYSFSSPKDFDLLRLPADSPLRRAVTIKNPIGEDLSVMRTTLIPTMLQNIVRNVRRGNEAGGLFEVANIFLAEELPLKVLPEERKTCVIGLWGQGDFFDLKGAVEAIANAFDLRLTFESGERSFLHPGITAVVKMGEKEVGVLGELHPAIAAELALEKKVYLCELDYAAICKKFAREISYHGLPEFRDVQRDIAVVVSEEVTCAQVEDCILRGCKAAKSAELFDVYRDAKLGENKKSMALRITFAADGKALTPETTDRFFNKILENLKRNLGAELR
ncbi:MAG: phenylalanine--tRNA ligase subunit beta [Clostridia bacterium]|nr:phenylalanine--tRNA ligase subunit beta [Clostridia bacterium]